MRSAAGAWEGSEDGCDLPLDVELAAPPKVRAGEVVDRYRIRSILGVGGHGVVYEAEHVELGYRVALKILDRDAGRDPRRRARFRREALAGARVRHRNVVGILDCGTLADGAPYLAMERIEGIDLASLLAREGPIDAAAAIEVGLALCAASAALSAEGLVHRDVKPENVMISRAIDGAIEIKLLDFGIVKAPRGLGHPSLTQDGFVLGTPHYMSPEQIRGEPLDARSDLYAIGAVLYESLSGGVPIDGEDTDAVLTKMLVQAPAPLEERRRDCPAPLAQIVARALAKDREARYRTPGAMAAALASTAEALSLPRGAAAWQRMGHALGAPPRQEPPRAERAGLSSWRAAQRALPTPAERPTALRARRRPPRLRPPWWPAVALLLAAIFGGVAVGAVGANCVPPAESPPR